MDYSDKRMYGISKEYIRPECVVREENIQVWKDIIRIEELRKQKLKEQKDAVLRANLQFLKKF